jgi:hypothetical protein
MIRIVCPHCHAPLSTAELEQILVGGQSSLICPECASVLVSEPIDAAEPPTPDEAFTEPVATHS